MKFIHVKAYIGNGNYRHHFLNVGLISAVNIYGNTKILEIIHNGKGFTFSLEDGKASGVISETSPA